MGWRGKSEKAKRGHRPSLKNWECDGLYSTFPKYVSTILPSKHPSSNNNIENKKRQNYESFLPFEKPTNDIWHTQNPYPPTKITHQQSNETTVTTIHPQIPARLDSRFTSPKDFHNNYEANLIPTVLQNIPYGHDVPPPPPPPRSSSAACCTSSSSSSSSSHSIPNYGSTNGFSFQEEKKECDDNTTTSTKQQQQQEKAPRTPHAWPALDKWSVDNLMNDLDLRERALKCGEDDDGKTIRLKLKHFIKYLHNNRDDSPLYIFDSTYDEDKVAKQLLSDYRVPTYFNEDLFHLVGESRRPPYRWFLVGPERSGTCVHIDPLATSAWNTLIYGKKHWVLFPPHVPKSIVKGKYEIRKGEDDEAIHYFMNILPRIKKSAAKAAKKCKDGTSPGQYKGFECYEFTQHEGETVYIPSGWWHAVLNLTHTVGVTQNFCSQRNFDDVWMKTRTGRKRMAYKWLCQLDIHYPHLSKRAREFNERDDFVMKYDPEEVARREQREREKKKRSKKERERRLSKSNSGSSDRDDYHMRHSQSSSNRSYRDSKRSRFERVVSP